VSEPLIWRHSYRGLERRLDAVMEVVREAGRLRANQQYCGFVKQTAMRHGVSERQFWRWLRAFEDKSIDGLLLHKPGPPRGFKARNGRGECKSEAPCGRPVIRPGSLSQPRCDEKGLLLPE
jgi:hypothetical protein